MAYDTAFAALADPTRRSMFERIRRQPHAVGELARAVAISQPAASQHLRVLRNARLVREQRQGTRRIYRVNPEGLTALRAYVESLWDDVLAAYAGIERPKSNRRTK